MAGRNRDSAMPVVQATFTLGRALPRGRCAFLPPYRPWCPTCTVYNAPVV